MPKDFELEFGGEAGEEWECLEVHLGLHRDLIWISIVDVSEQSSWNQEHT